MMKNNSKDNEGPLSIFRVDFSCEGLSWAEQFYQSSSRYINSFREQFQKACTDVDDWLSSVPDETAEQLVSIPATDNMTFYGVHETSETEFNNTVPILNVMEPDENNLAANMIPEMGVPVSQEFDQKPSGYDSFITKVQIMFNDVDDWLKPVSGECIRSPVYDSVKVHEMSESTSKSMEPTLCEIEHQLAANINTAIDTPPEADASSKFNKCSLSRDLCASQHACDEELEKSISSNLEHEITKMVYDVYMVNQYECSVASEPLFNETEFGRENLKTNLALHGHEHFLENHTFVSFEGYGCGAPFDFPQLASFESSEVSISEHCDNLANQVFNVSPNVHPTNVKSEVHHNLLINNMRLQNCYTEPDLLEHETLTEVCTLLKGDQEEHPLSLKVHVAILSASLSDTNKLIPADLDDDAISFDEEYDSMGGRDSCAFPASEYGISNDCVDKLEITKLGDSLVPNFSIKSEEFEDVELEDCGDNLDSEEISITSRSSRTNFSYKKKLKNIFKSISWPSRKKSSEKEFSFQCNVMAKEICKDPSESDWEVV